MSVVATAAAVRPAPVPPSPAVPYGMCGGAGARKRKDVVHYHEEEEEEEEVVLPGRRLGGVGEGHGLFVLETVEEEEEREAEAEAANERSSIGPVSEGDEEEGEEAESARETTPWQRTTKKSAGGLASLDALDDALPVKRGLSSFFSGKSRSFANLQDVAGAGTTSSKDVLAKPENPFNKRRRILRCCSIRRVSSTSLTALPPFLPPEPSFNIGNDGVINGGGGGAAGG